MVEAAAQAHYLTAVFLGSTAFTFLNFGLPIYADDLGMDAVAIGATYTVFTGTLLLFRPLVGWALDRFGRRWFFTGAFAFYALAMGVFTQAESSPMAFFVARALQGVGASLMWVTARTMIGDLHSTTDRGTAMGRLLTTSVRGSIFGALFGFTLLGFMPMREAWAPAFAGYAAAALLALAWSVFRVRETQPEGTLTARQPLRFTTPLWRVLVIVFLSGFASALIEPIYLLFLKNKFDAGVVLLAYVFLPAGIVFAILPRYAGNWSDRRGRGPVIAAGVLLAGMVSTALPFWPSLWLVALSYLLFAAGWAMASPAEDALVVDLSDDANRGRVMGVKEAAGGAGAALGPLVGGWVYEYVAVEAAFVLNGLLLLVAAALALLWFSAWSTKGR